MLTYADVCGTTTTNVCVDIFVVVVPHTSAYVSIRQHTLAHAYVSIRMHTLAYIRSGSAYTYTHVHKGTYTCVYIYITVVYVYAYVAKRQLRALTEP
jgi:hypothetical protein